MFKIAIVVLALNPLTSCSPVVHPPVPLAGPVQERILGRWVEVLPGSDGDAYVFKADGTIENAPGNGQILRGWRLDGALVVLDVVAPDGTVQALRNSIGWTPDGGMLLTPEGADWGRVFRRD